MKNNPERNRARAKAWYEANKDLVKARRHQSYLRNKSKIAKQNKAWRKANPERHKLAQRKHKLKQYGITLEEYEEMFIRQRGLCAICLGEPSHGVEHFDIDHCHASKFVRGLLCRHCNQALGHMKDEPMALFRAALYLQGRLECQQ